MSSTLCVADEHLLHTTFCSQPPGKVTTLLELTKEKQTRHQESHYKRQGMTT